LLKAERVKANVITPSMTDGIFRSAIQSIE